MVFLTIWLLSLGFFFGSMLGRTSASYWTTSVAAVGIIIRTLDTILCKEQDAPVIKEEAKIYTGECE